MAEICNEFYEMCFGLQNTEYVYKNVLAFIKLICNELQTTCHCVNFNLINNTYTYLSYGLKYIWLYQFLSNYQVRL